jgi:hypothetical protein
LRHAHLLLVGLGLRLDAQRDNRLREFDLLEDDRIVSSQSVCEVLVSLRPTAAAISPAQDLLYLFALVCLEAHDAAEALFGAGVEL